MGLTNPQDCPGSSCLSFLNWKSVLSSLRRSIFLELQYFIFYYLLWSFNKRRRLVCFEQHNNKIHISFVACQQYLQIIKVWLAECINFLLQAPTHCAIISTKCNANRSSYSCRKLDIMCCLCYPFGKKLHGRYWQLLECECECEALKESFPSYHEEKWAMELYDGC